MGARMGHCSRFFDQCALLRESCLYRFASCTHVPQRSGVGSWLYLADWYGGGTKRLIGSHLACFHAGNFIYVSAPGDSRLPETHLLWNKGRKITEQPNHCRVWPRTERGLLEHLCKFTVRFTFYSPHGGICSPALGLGSAPRPSVGKLLKGTSPDPLSLRIRKHTTR